MTDGAELEAKRSALLAAARSEWPGVDLDERSFAEFVAAREPVDPLHAGDLYLACACAGGDQAAIAAFLRAMVPHIEAAVLGLGGDHALVDEVRAELVDALLVGPRPGIATYAAVALDHLA